MDTSMGIDWSDYLHCLSDDQIRELATWLASEFLKVSEFTDLVDRVYAQAPDEWRRQPPDFIDNYGRPMVERYAHRKRVFAEQQAALEDGYMSGAFPDDVVGAEFAPLRSPEPAARSVDEALSVLERLRSET